MIISRSRSVVVVAMTLLSFSFFGPDLNDPHSQFRAEIRTSSSVLNIVEESLRNRNLTNDVVDYISDTAIGTRKLRIAYSNGILFTAFDDQQCKNNRVIQIPGSDTVNINSALKSCVNHPLCHSVSCTAIGCLLNVAACVLQSSRMPQSTVYVIIPRTPQKLNLLKKLHDDLIDISILKANRSNMSSELPEQYKRILKWDQPTLAVKNWSHEHNQPFIEVTSRDFTKFKDPPGYVDPIHKIVLFVIPKVASTGLRRLYDRLVGHEDITLDTNSVIEMHHRDFDITRERISFSSLNETIMTQLMNDPRYRKVVFFRDPATRALSCYLHLFLLKSTLDKRESFSKHFKQESTSWDQFVSYVAREGPPPYGTGPMVNPHYRKQLLIGNLYKFLPLFDFIGLANGDHIRLMLEKYNLWKRYGSVGWSARGGFMQEASRHKTGASNSSLETYFTKSVMERLKVAYHMDFSFMNFVGLKTNGMPTNGYKLTPFKSICGDRLRRPICWPGEPHREFKVN